MPTGASAYFLTENRLTTSTAFQPNGLHPFRFQERKSGHAGASLVDNGLVRFEDVVIHAVASGEHCGWLSSGNARDGSEPRSCGAFEAVPIALRLAPHLHPEALWGS
jgi:hypothetical protein